MIPKQFTLAGRRWTVLLVSRLPRGDRGVVDHIKREVRIARTGRNKEQQMETLLHEMAHAVLNEVEPAYNKEKFVQPFAKRLSRAILSARF